nr:MAG TPA: hypothetical protein [Caudoviricetes sp.]
MVTQKYVTITLLFLLLAINRHLYSEILKTI